MAYFSTNIPMYANHALLFADLNCFKTKTNTEDKAFDLTFKYMDDVL